LQQRRITSDSSLVGLRECLPERDHPRQVQGIDELGLAAERFGRVDAGRWRRRLPVRDESELGRIQAGHILQRTPVNG
jgi:hypothetical protein